MVMSRYEARNTIGLAEISIFVIWCDDDERLSRENVRSTSSKNRTLSVALPILMRDIPRRPIVKAMIP